LGGDCSVLSDGSSIVGGAPSVLGDNFAALSGDSGALGEGPSVPGGGRRILEFSPEVLELAPDARRRGPGFLGAAMANDCAGRAGPAWKTSVAGY
jgi:hypothetical protein